MRPTSISLVACCAHQVQSFDLDQKVLVPGGFEGQIFLAQVNKTQGVGRSD